MTNATFYNDVYVWNHETHEWSSALEASPAAQPFAQKPAPRQGNAAAVFGEWLYIYGGNNSSALFDDLWKFSFETNLWTQVAMPVNGAAQWPPEMTQMAVIILDRDSPLFLMTSGAIDIGFKKFSSQLWSFSSLSETWMLINTSSLQLETSNLNLSGAMAVYYHHEIYMYGGESDELLSDQLSVIQPGCNPGYFSTNFVTSECQPCPPGTYSSRAGVAECDNRCSAGVLSPAASTTKEACASCANDVCEQGDCSISAQGQPTCSCKLGWRGATCNVPLLAILAATLGGCAIIVAIAVIIRRRAHKRHLEYEARTGLFARLVDEAKHEISEIEQGWDINFEDIRPDKIIGNGTFGVVSKK